VISLLYRLADSARHRARRRRSSADIAAGRRGEDLAHRFLRRQGFTVVARNYRPRAAGAGEVDLIAWEHDYLAFVEVKSRATDEFGAPERAVDPEKQAHLERAAREYARRARVDWDFVRFDIVSVLLTAPPKIELLRDAFRPKRTI
jgi:putative endonuclease